MEEPTRADRLAAARMKLDEALAITQQIAAALEAPHEQGVIHRDLKPSSITLRPDGTVKVDRQGSDYRNPELGARSQVSAASL